MHACMRTHGSVNFGPEVLVLIQMHAVRLKATCLHNTSLLAVHILSALHILPYATVVARDLIWKATTVGT